LVKSRAVKYKEKFLQPLRRKVMAKNEPLAAGVVKPPVPFRPVPGITPVPGIKPPAPGIKPPAPNPPAPRPTPGVKPPAPRPTPGIKPPAPRPTPGIKPPAPRPTPGIKPPAPRPTPGIKPPAPRPTPGIKPPAPGKHYPYDDGEIVQINLGKYCAMQLLNALIIALGIVPPPGKKGKGKGAPKP
jgi:hypothetical protein